MPFKGMQEQFMEFRVQCEQILNPKQKGHDSIRKEGIVLSMVLTVSPGIPTTQCLIPDRP